MENGGQMKDGNHEVELNNGAAWWLVNLLNNAGIFTKTADLFNFGILLAGPLEPMLATPDEAWADDKKQSLKLDWMAKAFPKFEITEAQREAVKRGLNTLAEKGALAPHKFILSLLKTFGLKP
jgi:hypothetical protein